MQIVQGWHDDTIDILFTHEEARWANNAMLHVSKWMEYADVMNTLSVVCDAYNLTHTKLMACWH